MREDGRMTRHDERGAPIVLDDDARARLRAALDREGVASVYLFGSQARGQAGPLSDVDLAVWAEPELDADARLDLRLDLIGAAEQALDTQPLRDELDRGMRRRLAEGTFGRR
jgi:predicted nucleotidyltransferase